MAHLHPMISPSHHGICLASVMKDKPLKIGQDKAWLAWRILQIALVMQRGVGTWHFRRHCRHLNLACAWLLEPEREISRPCSDDVPKFDFFQNRVIGLDMSSRDVESKEAPGPRFRSGKVANTELHPFADVFGRGKQIIVHALAES